MKTVPSISVIVCTYNRAHAILPCLESIDASRRAVPAADVEIVVVDNASTDGTGDIVRTWSAGNNVPVLLLSEPRPGKCRALNMGIRGSRGDLLIFTDDDCRLDVNHIRDALRHDAADARPVVRGGRIELGDSSDLPLTIKTDDDFQVWTLSENSARQKIMRGAVSGCNMVMRREVFNAVGPFDERFGPGTPIPGSEDTDYIYRAYLAGYAVRYVPDMAVYHFHGRRTADEGRKLLCDYRTGNGAIYIKYMFRHFDFCRPLIWDIRNFMRELKTGKSLFYPEYGLSYRKVLASNIKGMLLYFRSVLFSPQR